MWDCPNHGRHVTTKQAPLLGYTIALLFLGPVTCGLTWLFVPLVLIALVADRPRCASCRREM